MLLDNGILYLRKLSAGYKLVVSKFNSKLQEVVSHECITLARCHTRQQYHRAQNIQNVGLRTSRSQNGHITRGQKRITRRPTQIHHPLPDHLKRSTGSMISSSSFPSDIKHFQHQASNAFHILRGTQLFHLIMFEINVPFHWTFAETYLENTGFKLGVYMYTSLVHTFRGKSVPSRALSYTL